MIYHMGYHRTANRLRTVRYLMLVCFVFFTLFLFFLFRQDMTLNHFRYLLRNFDWSSNVVGNAGDTIYYSGESGSAFGFVDGGLACITESRVFVTDRSSGTTFSHYHGYTSPKGVFSEKYMAVFDRRGSSLSLYNAFACLETLTFDGQILAVALSDGGELAVAVAEGSQYYSTVYVYNSRLEQVNKLSKYKYVTSLAFSENGKKVAVASLYSDQNASLSSELMLMTVGKKEADAVFTYTAEAIASLEYQENGSLAVVTDRSLRIYEKNADLMAEVPFDTVPDGIFRGEQGLLLFSAGADRRNLTVSVLGKKGESLFDGILLSGKLRGMGGDGNAFYLLTEDSLSVMDTEAMKTTTYALSEQDATAFLLEKGELVYDGDAIYYATASSAKTLEGILSAVTAEAEDKSEGS